MNCRFCNAELEDGSAVCPECGRSQEEPETAVEQPAEVQEAQPETAAPPKPKLWMLIVAGVLCLALLLGMIYVVLVGAEVDVKGLFKKKEPPAVLPPAASPYAGPYTEDTAEAAVANKDVVVATINGNKLTNGMLQVYYSKQVNDFLSYYAYYLEYMELDKTKPFSEQVCYFDEGKTWEEYFLDAAVGSWQRYQTLSVLAYDGDFQLDELLQKDLTDLKDLMEAGAKAQGLESAEALVQQEYGANCSVDNYISYMTLYYAGLQFYTEKYDEYAPTMEQIQQYYTDNEAVFTQEGITKESGMRSNVRHILIKLQGGTVDATTGTTTYSEEEWDTCRKEAQKLLDQWRALGEGATEEAFAKLANEHSDDGGSNTNGGLYEGIDATTSFVEPFLKWSIDSARKAGDTEIVETEYGCHIMYYSSGEENWIYTARSGYLTDKLENMIKEATEKWPMDIDYEKISLAPLKLS